MKTRAILTTSQQRLYRLCPAKHDYRHNWKLESSGEAQDAFFGTICHDCWEAYYLAWQHGHPKLDAALTFLANLNLEPYLEAQIEALLVGYHLRWGDAPLEILAVEQEFRAPLRNPATGHRSRSHDLGGKMDVVLRDLEDGLIKVMEHKTTGSDITPGSPYWQRLRLDDQVSNYIIGGKALGYEIAGVLYDVAKRPTQKPLRTTPLESQRWTKGKEHKACEALGCPDCLDGWVEKPRLDARQRLKDEAPNAYYERICNAIAEAPQDYYQRATIVRFEDELQMAQQDTWATLRQIRDSQASGYHPRNPNACNAYNSQCGYFPLCTGEATPDSALYQVREAEHPELKGQQ